MRYRNCVFTLNNYTDTEYNNLLYNTKFKYIIIGKEISDSGTHHLQGYFELLIQTRHNKIKAINPRMHFEKRKGSQKQAIDYCKKSGNFIENGISRMQGQRNDLNKLKIDLSDGRSIAEIVLMENLNYPQLRFLILAEPYLYKPKLSKRSCIWCYGETGTGKSHFAKTYTDLSDIYFKDVESKWWDGYTNQSVVVFDELRADCFKINYMLRLLDDLPLRVEYKGGTVPLRCETIIITSPLNPMEMYGKCNEKIEQLMRRIDKLQLFEIGGTISVDKGNTILTEIDFNQL